MASEKWNGRKQTGPLWTRYETVILYPKNTKFYAKYFERNNIFCMICFDILQPTEFSSRIAFLLMNWINLSHSSGCSTVVSKEWLVSSTFRLHQCTASSGELILSVIKFGRVLLHIYKSPGVPHWMVLLLLGITFVSMARCIINVFFYFTEFIFMFD